MDKRKELFEHAPIPKAVAAMAVPTIISMLVVIIYNMADTFFVGQTGDSMQVAAVSLATPVFLLFMAVGNLYGIGGSSEIARSLGRKDMDRVKKVSSFCCYASIITGLIMLLIFQFGMEQILAAIGASANTIDFARDYLRYISFGGVFIILATAFGNIVRAEGAAKEAMVGNMIGTIVNIILDPVFILGLKWGVVGAAVATVIGNIAACVFYLHYFLKKHSVLSISYKDFSAGNGIAKGVAGIGIPASLNNILMSIANIILNAYLIQYGDTPVAAMGVAQKLNMLVVLLQIGLCMGVQPLIAYNFGAGNPKRMKKVIKFVMGSAIVMGSALTLIVVLAKGTMIRIFIQDDEVIAYGIKMVTALMLTGPVLGILFTCINTLQGMGKAMPSLLLTVCRQGLIFVPFVIIMNSVLGLEGIIYAQPVADMFSIVVAFIVTMSCIKKFEKSLQKA